MKYILDTDHVIFYLNNHPAVVKAIRSSPRNRLAITRFTHAELLYGAYKSGRIAHNLARIRIFVKEIKVLEFTQKAAYTYAKIKADLIRKGKPCPNLDLLIGSIAIANRIALVTNNTRDFQNIESLKLENWTNVKG